MISDKEYNKIADEVYDVDSSKIGNPLNEGRVVVDETFIILKSEDNPDNGMQAMAVAPVDKNGEADYSEVVIAYAGTNSKNVADLVTDGKMIGLGDTEAYGFHPNRMMIPAQSATALD
ncbi:triacylglycerol lipase, partial [Streptococcus pluranimalium]